MITYYYCFILLNLSFFSHVNTNYILHIYVCTSILCIWKRQGKFMLWFIHSSYMFHHLNFMWNCFSSLINRIKGRASWINQQIIAVFVSVFLSFVQLYIDIIINFGLVVMVLFKWSNWLCLSFTIKGHSNTTFVAQFMCRFCCEHSTAIFWHFKLNYNSKNVTKCDCYQ